ncbi:MAG: hypothetical protein IKI11_11305, partial [Neisseriaceae bacterium]|nr:hypothetical protein [Neisseriaceae bacterium]
MRGYLRKYCVSKTLFRQPENPHRHYEPFAMTISVSGCLKKFLGKGVGSMNKRIVLILLSLLPAISAVVSYIYFDLSVYTIVAL